MKFDYNSASLDELDERAVQQLIFDDKDVFSLLKGHLIIEGILETLIKRNLKYPNHLLNKRQLSFDFKVDLLRSLDAIPEKIVSPIKAINKLRNDLAHTEEHEITMDDLKKLQFEWEGTQKTAFNMAYKRKGIGEATTIATLFLVWRCLHLITKPGS
jgi:hypothetical protein